MVNRDKKTAKNILQLTIILMLIIIGIKTIGGYEIYRGTGRSMYPTLYEDYTISKRVDPVDLIVGDIITYNQYFEDDDEYIQVCHRILEITNDGFITKGDNNEYEDYWIVVPESIDGKILYRIKGFKISKVKQGGE